MEWSGSVQKRPLCSGACIKRTHPACIDLKRREIWGHVYTWALRCKKAVADVPLSTPPLPPTPPLNSVPSQPAVVLAPSDKALLLSARQPPALLLPLSPRPPCSDSGPACASSLTPPLPSSRHSASLPSHPVINLIYIPPTTPTTSDPVAPPDWLAEGVGGRWAVCGAQAAASGPLCWRWAVCGDG